MTRLHLLVPLKPFIPLISVVIVACTLLATAAQPCSPLFQAIKPCQLITGAIKKIPHCLSYNAPDFPSLESMGHAIFVGGNLEQETFPDTMVRLMERLSCISFLASPTGRSQILVCPGTCSPSGITQPSHCFKVCSDESCYGHASMVVPEATP